MEITFTDRQLDIMNILWEEGSATVREARESLDEEPAYTSVLTLFQTLEKNGQVRHEAEGKAYRYYPTVSREEAGRKAVEYVRQRIFQGSSSKITETVLDEVDLPPEEEEVLEETVEEMSGAST